MIKTIVLGAVILYGIPMILGLMFVAGLKSEWHSMDDAAESVLLELGLASCVQSPTWYDMSAGSAITAFELSKYDNHTDQTDLRAAVMAHAAQTKAWQVKEITVQDYMEALHTYLPEAAFLRPADDLVFDAAYTNMLGASPAELAFFDQDSGLMIYLCTYVDPPAAGSVKVDRLTIPHSGIVYEVETHGGFHGDGITFQAFLVPEDERAGLEETLANHSDWHAGTVTRAEYIRMQDKRFYEIPGLYPCADVDFDWWSYVDTYARAHPNDPDTRSHGSDDFPAVIQQAGAVASMNWLVALYDADTGLFVYYEYDS